MTPYRPSEYAVRVHDLAADARGHQDRVTLALGSILYLSQEQVGKAIPVSPDARRGLSFRRWVGLVLVGMACSGWAGAGSENKEAAVAVTKRLSPGKAFREGQAAMLTRDYPAAVKFFTVAAVGPGAVKALSLRGECELYAGDSDAVVATCDELDAVTVGLSPDAPYLRGLVALKGGDKGAARLQFKSAEMLGHPKAGVMARRCE